MIDKTTGYIRLNKFSQQTYREFMESLDSLKAKGAANLVLDLRGNGGGVLDEAVEIADEFLAGDKLITFTEGLHNKRKDYRCRRLGQFESGGLAVLIDENTASASEILSGALQDWDRAEIIGRRSFGKGLVQEQFDLSDNSAVRLTVARYYTPLGRCIQRSYSQGEDAYFEEFAHRFNSGEYLNADSIKNDTSTRYRTSRGKVLYGGGGITPDYFVPGDTGMPGDFSMRVLLSGLINSFGYRYALKHPELSANYTSPEDFASRFRIGKEEWTILLGPGAEDSLSAEYIGQKDLDLIKDGMKRSVCRQIWKNEGYYRMINADDPGIRKAIELFRNKKPS
jgi:carboxyl-terminal processing protease